MIYDFSILRKNIEIGKLYVESCSISYDSKAKIKRAGQIVISAEKFDMNKKIIKASDYVFFDGTKFFNGTWSFADSIYTYEEFKFDMMTDRIMISINGKSVGIFMIVASPLSYDDKNDKYSLEIYDETFIVDQSCLTSRLFITSGTKYIDFIRMRLTTLGFSNVLSDDSDLSFTSDREFEYGMNELELINLLLTEMNYNSLHIDENGYIKITKKENTLTPKHKYFAGKNSILLNQMTSNFDIYNIPNIFVGVVSNPDVPMMQYTRINDDIGNKLSTIRRGYNVPKTYKFDNIASEEELKTFIDNEYVKSLQTIQVVNISTKIENNHEFEDVVQLHTNDIKGLFREVSWEINLSTGGTMTHTLERAVFI
ncbi:MAG: hypothetical protein ACK5L6_01185 [Anaerorhabdus sp.]|uniref:hypothetical protein n=1 Tax=Anaerorhabdus sp. TaxID=1872524 RepID=UPI003A88F4D6